MNVNDYIKTEVIITPEDIKDNFNALYDALQIKGRELSIKNAPELYALLSRCTKETFLKDRFMDDFSTLITEMCKRGASREELDVVIRFTGMVLNNACALTLREALDGYPTITKIFDKYYKKDSDNTFTDILDANLNVGDCVEFSGEISENDRHNAILLENYEDITGVVLKFVTNSDVDYKTYGRIIDIHLNDIDKGHIFVRKLK